MNKSAERIIPFNKPFVVGNELPYIEQAVLSGNISGNGAFTKKCQSLFEHRYNSARSLLTSSCTDALEMAAILLDIGKGDEVIIPSYTFVSTANPFIMRGATIVFADSRSDMPNLDVDAIGALITERTKAIVVVHYAGVACDMDRLKEVIGNRDIEVIEDAAQAIDSFYKNRPLGTIGALGTFSFHETKNVIAGEGGLLSVNQGKYASRAEIIWEKGTNRAAFWRGEVDKYGWVDIGSSFLPSEITAAFLYAQFENIDAIQSRRLALWHYYNDGLKELAGRGCFEQPVIPSYATNNAHMYYLLCASLEERGLLISHLKSRGVHAVFHYLSLHASPYFHDKYAGGELVNADRYSDLLLRLPMYYDLDHASQDQVIDAIHEFYTL